MHLALYKFYLDANEPKNAILSMKTVLQSPEINPDAKAKVFNDFVNFVSKNPEWIEQCPYLPCPYALP